MAEGVSTQAHDGHNKDYWRNVRYLEKPWKRVGKLKRNFKRNAGIVISGCGRKTSQKYQEDASSLHRYVK